jgi:predicted ester cyclase
VIGLLAGCGGTEKAQLDTFNAAKTKAEANKSLVRHYYQVMSGGDLKVLDDLLSPNYNRYLSATTPPINADAQKQRLAGLRAAFPDLQIRLDSIVAEGDYVAVYGTVKGTQQGTFQGIPPTGKQVTVWACELIRIENGKMIEHWGGTDNLVLVQQLGMTLSPGK